MFSKFVFKSILILCSYQLNLPDLQNLNFTKILWSTDFNTTISKRVHVNSLKMKCVERASL